MNSEYDANKALAAVAASYRANLQSGMSVEQAYALRYGDVGAQYVPALRKGAREREIASAKRSPLLRPYVKPRPERQLSVIEAVACGVGAFALLVGMGFLVIEYCSVGWFSAYGFPL